MKYLFSLLFFCLSLSTLSAALCDFTGPTGGSWSEPDNWTCDCDCPEKIPDMGDDAFISGKTVILDLGIRVKSLNLMAGAVLDSPVNLLEITDGLIWAAGTIKTSIRIMPFGAVAMLTGGVKTLDGNLALDTGVSATWDAGPFSILPGGELILAGDPGLPPSEFAITFDGDIGGFDGTISNGGVFTKVGGGGTSSVSPGFTNGGGIVVMSGILEMAGGISDNPGIMDIAAGTTLRIKSSSGSPAGATLGGAGTLEFAGGGPHDIDFNFSGPTNIIFNSFTVLIEGNLNPLNTVEIRRGFVGGGGFLDIAGDLLWSGGSLAVTTDIGIVGNLELLTTDSKILTATLTQDGATDWQSGRLIINAPGSFINNGSFENNNGAFEMSSAAGLGAGTFINNGFFTQKSGVSNEIGTPYTNTGTTHIDDGELDFARSATFTSGILEIDAGETMKASSPVIFEAPSAIQGEGTTIFTLGVSRVATNSVSRLEKWIVNLGELEIDAAIDPQAFDARVDAGRLEIKENILPDSLLVLVTGGTFRVSSSISPAVLQLSQTDGTIDLQEDISPVNCSLTQTGGVLMGIVEGDLSELTFTESFDWSGGRVDLKLIGDGASTIAMAGTATKTLSGIIQHNGVACWTDGELAIPFGGEWFNGGTFHAASDSTISGSGNFFNGGTFLKTGGGTLSIAPSFTNSELLTGIGGINFGFTFTNLGTTRPGLSPGTLSLSQQFSNGSRLEMEVASDAGPGIGHDLLIVADTAWLSDSLIVTELAAAPNGDYTILICQGEGQCIQGDFDFTSLPPDYSYSLTDTSVVLTKGIVPVSWLSFSVRALSDRIQLDWTTALEQDNAFFVVERSFNGQAFHPIGEVAGNGNTNSPTAYQFFDEDLPNSSSLVAYRIKQIDLDGSFSYSPIDQVRWHGRRQLFLIDQAHLPYPNELHIRMQGVTPGRSTRLALLDINGRVLQEKRLEPGQTEVYWRLAQDLSQGVYFIRAEDGQQLASRKLLQGH